MNLFLIAWVSDMPIIDSDETYPMFQSPAPFLFYHHFSSRLSMFFMGSHDLLEHGSISGPHCWGKLTVLAATIQWLLRWGGLHESLPSSRWVGLILCSSWYGRCHCCCCSRGGPHHLWLSNRSAPLPQHGWALGEVLLSHVRHHLTLRALARASVTLLCWMSAV